ncbi:unnamed protein product [Phaedon cochleariae]|uniref:SH3 domain-containing protein n=1 Tax=Phaedon cochleariae TaxID=80249 RepID=A0A9P0GL39_PHACE|nr:unnamed protein product [Phaedon cochleariae]
MYNFKLNYLILILFSFHTVICDISEKRICVDENCKEPISLAKTLLRYSSPEPGVLSFSPNADVTIFSKDVDSKKGYWEVEINGKRGYVPKTYIRESKILNKNTIIINTPLDQQHKLPLDTSGDDPNKILEKPISTDKIASEQTQTDISGRSQTDLTPDNVKEPYEVVDGTTIFSEPSDISPSSTEAPVHSTYVVPENNESVNASHSNDETMNPKASMSEDVVSEVVQNVLVNAVNSNTETNHPKDALPEDLVTNDNNEKADSLVQKAFSSISNFMNNDSEDLVDEDDEEFDIDDEEDEEDEDDQDETQTPNENLSSPNADQTIQDSELKNNAQVNELNAAKIKEVETPIIEVTLPPNIQDTTEVPFEEAEALPLEVTVTPEPSKLSTEMPLEDLKPIPDEVALAQEPITPSTETPVGEAEASAPKTLSQNSGDEIKIAPSTETPIDEAEASSPKTLPQNSGDEIKIAPSTETPVDEAEASSPKTLPQNSGDEMKIVISDSETLSEDVQIVAAAPNSQGSSDDSQDVTTDSSSLEKTNSEKSSPVENDLPGPSSIVYNFIKAASQASEVSLNNSEEAVLDSQENTENTQGPQVFHDSGNSFSETDELNMSPQIVTPKYPDVDTAFTNSNSTGIEETSENMESSHGMIYSAINDTEKKTEPDQSSNENIAALNSAPEQWSIDEKADENERNILPEESLANGEVVDESPSLYSSILGFFNSDNSEELDKNSTPLSNAEQKMSSPFAESQEVEIGYCDTETCKTPLQGSIFHSSDFSFNYDLFLYLSTSAISCIIFLFIYLAMDKSKRLKPLIAKINQLEKELLISLKENEMLQERGPLEITEINNTISSDTYDLLNEKLTAMEMSKQVLEMEVFNLQQAVEGKQALEQQIEMLEKELETSTEVGMELNRIISEMLDPTDGSERLKENVEQLQRQLFEQKMTIEEGNNMLGVKEAENLLLQSELEASKNKIAELLGKLDEMVENILKIETDKEQEQKSLQEEIAVYQQKYNEGVVKIEILTNDIQTLKAQLTDSQRQAELRIKEYNILKDSLKSIKSMSNDTAALHSLLDATSMKAEYHQLKIDNENYLAQLKQEQAAKSSYEKKCQAVTEDNLSLTKKYGDAEKEKVEANMKLEVLNNYFKKKEEELQGDILKYKSIWEAKQGEATSTTERIKLMQEEIENYKSQNEILKQEIVSQEIDLKSQISMLEKKVHENWVNARQTERKLEDARQEAAQLRNRITLTERNQNRLQSPVDQNGDLNMSTNSFDSPASPPMLFTSREHLPNTPPAPLIGLPPPFLPPPPGAPFLPPPPHDLPFLPNMFPRDHRPPPLGRLSSPPPPMGGVGYSPPPMGGARYTPPRMGGARYSPDSSAFSPYDRGTPSPAYDSEYGASPPDARRYGPYERVERREWQRAGRTANGRSQKGSMMSSGSDHSVESLDKLNRKQSKMV